MKRRDFIKNFSSTAMSMSLLPGEAFESYLAKLLQGNPQRAMQHLQEIAHEQPARAEIKTERGGPRLYLNGKEIYPLLALSTHMFPTIDNFRKAGIHMYHPLVGMRIGWLGENTYDWSKMDAFFSQLLELDPDAYFMPRLQLRTPVWWKEAHPDEMLQFGLKTSQKDYNIIEKRQLEQSEGGIYFRARDELWEASFASKVWREDTATMLRAFAEHIERSPLRSRIIGYMPTTGQTGEWNTFGPDFLPDYSAPMRRACGEIPDSDARLQTTFGLLRDPAKESRIISFYQKYHDTIADTALRMCQALREATKGRAIVGVFYGYLLEQVRIQEGGYLAMRKFLQSPYIDYIAGPYSYMPGNVTDKNGVRYTTQDGAGNLLGNARGVAGDGGFRMLTESLRRHGKLYFSEMDPSTHLDKNPLEVFGGHGGEGSDTVMGSRRIMQRDLGQVFASGSGGWLYDFGPLNQAENGWYASEEIIQEISRFVKMGELRQKLDITPVAEIAAVYDDQVFCATEHWLAGKPWSNYAIKATDFFNHWFLNSQARAFHRLGAPMDFLYARDLRPEDARRYKLIFMVNHFFMDQREVGRISEIFHNSGATVVWFYAPGLMTPEKLDPSQMEGLTGFKFKMLKKPGAMLIKSTIQDDALEQSLKFGVNTPHWPRFAVTDEAADAWGMWDGGDEVALAGKEHAGYHSIYCGAAPLPIPLLRWLAKKAHARLWCNRADIVRATEDAAMIVATSTGQRTLSLHKPMALDTGGQAKQHHDLELEKGEVRIFVKPV